ncbi:MAG: LptF/LptG family permease [Spirochaetia bacterium]
MKTLHSLAVKQFIPIFIGAILFFVLILQLVDIFANLWRYLNLETPIIDIARIALYYTPKCISYAIPTSLLFAIAYTMGTFYANSELIMVFGSGIPLHQFISPFIIIGFLLSVGGFFFEEYVVIDTFRMKNQLSSEILRQSTSYSNSNVTIKSGDNRVIYHADYYNDSAQTLSGVTFIELGEDWEFVRRVDADWAQWNEDIWELQSARIFMWNEDRSYIEEEAASHFSDDTFSAPPSRFRRVDRNVDELNYIDAYEYIDSLRRAGLQYRAPLTEYYRRFSFALTPLIVALLSSAIGGRFKKNILLMSLLFSLVLSVIYYVTQMITVLMAKLDYMPPLLGAWGAFFFFLIIAFFLFRTART